MVRDARHRCHNCFRFNLNSFTTDLGEKAEEAVVQKQADMAAVEGVAWRPFTANGRPSKPNVAACRQRRRLQSAALSEQQQQADLVASSASQTVDLAVRGAQPVADIAARAVAAPPQPPPPPAAATPSLTNPPLAALLLGGAVLAGFGIKRIYDTPSRSYDQNVGQEYDAWTDEGILEYYWGEHIHLGYYNEEVGAGAACHTLHNSVRAVGTSTDCTGAAAGRLARTAGMSCS
jgi:hypothetical protein